MKRSYLKYITSLLLFGSNGIVAGHIDLTSYEIVLLRTMTGSALLIALFFLTKQKITFTKDKRNLLFIVLSGAAMGTSWMFLYEAYSQIGVSIATLLYYCGPVIVMVLSPVLFKERLTWSKTAGFFAVLAGIFLVNGNVLSGSGNLFGLFCGLMSAVLYSVMVMANKRSRTVKGMENAAIQLFIGFLTVSVFVGFKSGYAMQISGGDWIWILVLGLINTGLGCFLYFSSIGDLSVQTVAVFGYLEPLSAVLFSVVLLNETMVPLQITGAALIIGGTLFGEFVRGKRRNT